MSAAAPSRARSRVRTLQSTLTTKLRRVVSEERASTYPLTKYQRAPVAYVRERLGFTILLPHQEEIMRAVCAAVHGDAKGRVAVSSGQKCGKTLTVICLALWFYECFPNARVFLTAAIELQLKNVLWRELGQVLRNAKEVAGSDMDGKLAASPTGGFVSTDGSREIKGIIGRDIESLAGLSGNMLTVVDEASALPEMKAQTFTGNTMGGGTLLWISNPTRGDGPFFEAFHRSKEHWQTFEVDGEEVARWQEEQGIRIPYTVTMAKVSEMAQIYGVDSLFYLVRVRGKFPINETGRAIQFHQIEAALDRWAETPEEGPLSIGYDPAGPGGGGDEHAWAMVRGAKCLPLFTLLGLDEDKAVDMTLQLLANHRRPGEVPHINVDAEIIGYPIFARLRAEAERRKLHASAESFTVAGVKTSSKHVRDPRMFERIRDEIIWNLAKWIAAGGAIPRDDKLQTELHEPVWTSDTWNRLHATSKDDIRTKLGRSPDRFDALALAVHPPGTWEAEQAASTGNAQPYTRARGTDAGGPAQPVRYMSEAYGVTRRRR